MREEFAKLVSDRFATGFETRLRGTREMVESATISCAATIQLEGMVAGYKFKAERANYPTRQPIVTVRAEQVGSNRGGSIGILEFVEAPNNTVWMKIPQYRGSSAANAWSPDNDGSMFAEFLSRLFDQFEKLGFCSAQSGKSTDLLQAATEQLSAANDAIAFASVGNACRSALIAVANLVYRDDMKPDDDPEPKGDDATTKLKHFVSFQLSAGRFRSALRKTIDGVWDLDSALVHRKNAQKRDAETCVELTSATVTAILRLQAEDA